ncbi:cytochrome P450 6B2 isoform X3 [Spodoptera frugiperda]|uniref:unspecific monooxygenase n=1 Tax=Spodoptera frugiperda TaxID=7108 RepID=A0A9R0EN25_SPOFR|nr:cytochrome P450 6B2 isoform X3 [Spodoptera frugiperda]
MFLYLTIILLVLLYYVVTRKYSYWEKKNVPHIKPTFLLGNYGDLILQKDAFGQTLQSICNKFPNEKFVGAYFGTEPALIPKDPEIIKLIVTKDFNYFSGRDLSEHNDKEPIAVNVFATYGDTWRVLRQNLTPLFSSAKMKNMFHLIEKCSHTLEAVLDRETKISNVVEVKSLNSRFTMECIGACAFGVDTKTLTEEKDENPFRKIASFAEPPAIACFLRVVHDVWPSIFYGLRLNIGAKVVDFFHNLVTTVMTQRGYKSSGRNDFIDLVMGWKESHHITGDSLKNPKTGEVKKLMLEVNDDLLVAQCFVFFAAGFGTSATTLSYTLFELAKNKDIQEKVLQEVDAYLERNKNKLKYECIMEMPYLEAVIDETLRIHPILGVIPRELMEDYTLPGGVKLEKGLRIHIPTYYLHHNPEYFPDPEVFRPERFLGDQKQNIIPYTYMPFGEGPRTCIGMRFAKMQMLAGLITMLKKYRLELADGMPTKLKFKAQSFITHPVGGIRIKFIEREGWESRVFAKDS